MPMMKMPEFMRQHRFHFIRLQMLEQRIEKNDALGFAEAGEIGVAVR